MGSASLVARSCFAQVLGIIGLVLSGWLHADSESVDPLVEDPPRGPFARAGHPDTRICPGEEKTGLLGRALRIQYQDQGSDDQNLQKATALLQLLSGALAQERLRYVSFSASPRWRVCREGAGGDYVFWRDEDGNWRLPVDGLRKYLSRRHEEMDAGLKGTAAEAWLLFSLADVLEGQGQDGYPHLERAFAILERSGDPDGIMRWVSGMLILLLEEGEPEPAWLEAYAKSARTTAAPAEVLPVVSVAPVYPKHAYRRRVSGYAVIECTVDATGRVREPKVVEESPQGEGFGTAASEAMLRFRYLPQVVDGKRVPVEGVRNRITFALE